MFDKNKFKAQLIASGLTVKDIAALLEVNESTVYRKIERDGDFSREEINLMLKPMKIRTPKQMNEIFFAAELA